MSKSRLVHNGDFLLTNSMSFGRPYITLVEGCIHDGWLVISLIGGAYCQDFLYYLLSSNYAYSQFSSKVTGAVVQNLNSDKVANSLFPIPPINEQERIVRKIETVVPYINTYERLSSNLSVLNEVVFPKLKKSILQEAIQGKLVPQIAEEGAAKELLVEIRKEKERLVKEGKLKKSALTDSIIFKGDDNKYYERIGKSIVCIDNEIPFEIPNTWSWVHLPAIGISELGKTMDKGKNRGSLLPYLCSINVYWNKIDLAKVKEALFNEQEVNKYLLHKGDLLICEGGDVGRSAIWNSDKEMYFQNALHRVTLYGDISPYYILIVLQCYKGIGMLDRHSKGMTIKHFTQNALHSIYLPLPPIDEQRRIVDKVQSITAMLQ